MSGRFAAESVMRETQRSERAAARYASLVDARFRRRLGHRVRLMRYLERRPTRFARLFAQLSGAPRLAEVLLMEDHERSAGDRLYLYREALRFGLRTMR